jgi:hypothetical protein
VQLFFRIKKLEQSQQKILQQIEKRSHCHRNEHDNTVRECSHKSLKARRHSISPDTSSHLRQVKTGELKSKIHSNLNKEIISNPVNSKDLKNLSNKMKNFILDNRVNYDTLHHQNQKKSCSKKMQKNTE